MKARAVLVLVLSAISFFRVLSLAYPFLINCGQSRVNFCELKRSYRLLNIQPAPFVFSFTEI